MPVDNHRDPGDNNRNASQPAPTARARRRLITRRNAILIAIGFVCAIVATILVGLIAYRLGFVDRYIAGQVKDTLANYGIRAEIRSFHTSLSPQTVEILGVDLYDAKTGVELWVNFDVQGRSNFRNILVPPPEPNIRILFAYSTAHIELKNSQIHYGDALHSLSGEARNLRATVQPDDPNAPSSSWMNTVTFSSTNSTFAYDGHPINNIDLEARGRVNQVRAEIQDLTLRSPIAETHLSGVMGDWRKLQYTLNVTSTIDLTQASDILQPGTTLRGAGNFVGTVNGDGDHYTVDGSIKSDALAADGVRLQ